MNESTTIQETGQLVSNEALCTSLSAGRISACQEFLEHQPHEDISNIVSAAEVLHDMAFKLMMNDPDQLMAYKVSDEPEPVADNASVTALEQAVNGDLDGVQDTLSRMSFEDKATTHSMASKLHMEARNLALFIHGSNNG